MFSSNVKGLLSINKLSFVACALLFCSCNATLDEKIKEVVRDKDINQEEWNELVSIAKTEDICVTDGEVDADGLIQYIKDYVPKVFRGFEIEALNFPAKSTSDSGLKAEEPIRIKFFLERSGSMVAYDSNQTNGDFKDAISTLLNRVPQKGSDQNIMFVVNDAVYPFPRTFREFLVSNGILM